MSAYNFPNSPSNGDTVNVAGVIYTYDSTDNAWKTGGGQSPAILSNGTTPSLSSGITAAEIRTLINASADPLDLSSVAQNIIPDADSTRDLGTSSKKFKDLYLSGSSLHLGSITIESDATSIVLPQLKIGTGANQVTLSGSGGALQAGGAGITFASLSGKPTTIAGYGITDALTLGTSATTALAGNTALFNGAYTSLTGIPTTIAHKNADIDIGSNDFITTGKVLFANMYSALSDLPNATTYHGMFAHVHATAAAYFAHGGNWIELANKSYVDTQVSALVDSAPATLNTLNELAAALNDDASFSTTVTNSLTAKAPLASPTLTGAPAAPTASSGTNTTQIATTAFVQAAVTAGGSYNDASVDTHLNKSTASSGEVLSWNGSDYDWVAQSGGGGGASVTTSDAAPSSPSAGDLWYNTNAGGLFVYYTDANSSQWVEVVGKTGATGATGAAGSTTIFRYANVAGFPGSPSTAELAYANDTNTLYLYNGTAWKRVDNGDESPVILTEPPTSTQGLTGGATSTVTMVAQDPEGFDIQYGIAYKTASNARPTQLSADTTINQSTGVYTLTASSNSAHAGSFKARLSASDGANTTTRFVDFNLSFYDFTISPAVSGQSNWTLASGALTLDTAQVYTITPISNMNINAKMWGAGGSTTGSYAGGAGGYASGTIALTGGTSYKIRVGSQTGGGTGGSGSGGGYSGIFVTSETHGNSVIIAGGGGGGCDRYSVDQQPGAGGGASGQTGGWVGGPGGGAGGTQSAGGAGSATGTNRAGTAGSALTGGTGNSAGSYGGGGGGSGYYGGGGGASRVGGDGGNNGMGGGGSGYIGHSSVSSGVNTAGNLGTPGNSSDSARGTAGNPAVAGKVVISASS